MKERKRQINQKKEEDRELHNLPSIISLIMRVNIVTYLKRFSLSDQINPCSKKKSEKL